MWPLNANSIRLDCFWLKSKKNWPKLDKLGVKLKNWQFLMQKAQTFSSKYENLFYWSLKQTRNSQSTF